MALIISLIPKLILCGAILIISEDVWAGIMEASPGFHCTNCTRKPADRLPVELIAGKKKKNKKSSRCPFGVGPMNHSRCPAAKEKIIAQVLGQKHVACYSKLFFAESGCDASEYHDKKKAKNPHAGVGLCALEKSPAIRRANGRGPNCVNIGTFAQQTKCCADILRKTNSRYFGTILCKKTPRCS